MISLAHRASNVSEPAPTLAPELVPFDLTRCVVERVLLEGAADALPSQEQEHVSVLNWRWTSKDPFAGHWEQILSWVQSSY